jgi:hypothetical protein
MAKPHLTLIPTTFASRPGVRGWLSGWVRRWRARLRRPRTAGIAGLNDHLRGDIGLPALCYRHGFGERGWIGRPRP